MAKNVVFDENSAARIAEAVKWVEQYSVDESPDDPYPEDGLLTNRTVIRGTFDGVWPKGNAQLVDYNSDTIGIAGQQAAFNYFAEVGEAGKTSACCIIDTGSEWVLIAAECG